MWNMDALGRQVKLDFTNMDSNIKDKCTIWTKNANFSCGRLVLAFQEFLELGGRRHAVGTGVISTFQNRA